MRGFGTKSTMNTKETSWIQTHATHAPVTPAGLNHPPKSSHTTSKLEVVAWRQLDSKPKTQEKSKEIKTSRIEKRQKTQGRIA